MTNEDKLFWEKFGAVIGATHDSAGRNIRVEFPDARVFFLHELSELDTLENLFKYCVPLLGDKGYYCELYYEKPLYVATFYRTDGEKQTVKHDNDPALALKKAIEEIVK